MSQRKDGGQQARDDGSHDAHLWKDGQDEGQEASQYPSDPRAAAAASTSPPVHTPLASGPIPEQGRGTESLRRRSDAARPGNTPLEPGAHIPVRQHILTAQEAKDMLALLLRSAAFYLSEVLSVAFRGLKKPLGYCVIVYILLMVFQRFSTAVHDTMAPLCWVPFVSKTAFCVHVHQASDASEEPGPSKSAAPPKTADYPRLMAAQSQTFEELFAEHAEGSRLALEIHTSKQAAGNLITLVEASKLKSREPLADALGNFRRHASVTGRGLQTFNARLGGAVDTIVASNQKTVKMIEEAATTKQSIVGMVKEIVFPGSETFEDRQHQILMREFRRSFLVLSEQLDSTISHAEASDMDLQELEERLQTIHSILVDEKMDLSLTEPDFLGKLWSTLRRDQQELKQFQFHRDLLADLGTYHERARAHVAGALQTLRALAEEVEELRLRVNAPQLLGDEISLEIHLQSIMLGINRLQESRFKAQIRQEQMVSEELHIDL